MNIFSRWIRKGPEPIYICQYGATGVIVNVAYQKGEELFHSSRLVGPGFETMIYAKKASYCSKVVDGVITILDEKNKVAATVVLQPEERRCIIKDDKTGEVTVAWEAGGFTAFCDGRKVAEARRVENLKPLREQYERSGYDLDCAYRMTVSQEVPERMKMWLGAVLVM